MKDIRVSKVFKEDNHETKGGRSTGVWRLKGGKGAGGRWLGGGGGGDRWYGRVAGGARVPRTGGRRCGVAGGG